MTSNSKSSQLFKSRLIEQLSRTHIAVPLTIFYGAALGIVIYSAMSLPVTPSSIALSFVGGFLLFTLIEYFVHRYVFHMETDTEVKEKVQYNFHGIHHDFPKEKDRLAMPPVVSGVLATVLISFFWLIMGAFGLTFGAGFISGYASYLVVHYSVHAFKPPKNFLKYLWIHHSIHHYKDNTVAYGVSSPLWDVIFRTMPDLSKK